MKRNVKLLAVAVVVATSGMFAPHNAFGDFGAGDLVVYRVGDGTAALTNAATAVFLDDYSTAGTLNSSLEMPTSASDSNNSLTASGTATSEGALTLSSNGQYLVLTGYGAIPGTASIAGTSTSGGTPVLRVVGMVDSAGNINTSTSTTLFSGNNIRSATSDGTNVWMAGANSGVITNTIGGNGTGTVVSTTTTNLRALEINDGQLYVSSASGTTQGTSFRIGQVGTGTPITSSTATTNLPGLGLGANPSNTPGVEAGPYAFAFATLGGGASPDTLYIADNGFGTSTSTSGALEKWTLQSGTWVETGSILQTGLTGVAIEPAVGGGEAIYFTTPTNIYEITDTSGFGGTLSGTPDSIATAGTNEAFRGISFAPAAVPEPASLAALILGGTALLTRRRKASR